MRSCTKFRLATIRPFPLDQVVATGASNHHPPLENPPEGVAGVRAYEQAAFLAASVAPSSAEAAAAAATAAASNAAAANAAAADASANTATTAAANAAATATATAADGTIATATAAANAAAAATTTTLAPVVSCASDGVVGGGIGDSTRDRIGDSISAGSLRFRAGEIDNPTAGGAEFGMTSGGDQNSGGVGLPIAILECVAGEPAGTAGSEPGGGHGAAVGSPSPPLQYSPFLPPPEQLAENGTAADVDGGVDAINAEEVGSATRNGVVGMGVNAGEGKEAEPGPGSAPGGTAEVVGAVDAAAATAAAGATTTAGVGGVRGMFSSTACSVVGVAAAETVATGGEGAVKALFPATACPERCAEEASVDRGCDAGGRDEGERRSIADDVGGGGDVAACAMVADRQGVGIEQGQCVMLSEVCCPGQGGLVINGQKRPRLELPGVHEEHEMVGAGILATEHSTSGADSIDGSFACAEEESGIREIFRNVPCESTHLPGLDMR